MIKADTQRQSLGRRRLRTLGGFVLAIAIWEIGARTFLLAGVVPPISAALMAAWRPDNREIFAAALLFTAKNALVGYLIGVSIGVALAIITLLVPILRAGIVHFSAIVNATPIVALGPVLLATVPRNNLPVAVAAFFVFFSVFIAMRAGFVEATKTHQDLFSVLGASRRKRFLHLELPACLPTLTSGLKVAAPAAVVGSIFGEWFGLDQGIGPLLITSMQRIKIDELWGAMWLSAALSVFLFALLTVVEKWVVAKFR